MSPAISNCNNSTTTLALCSDGLYIYWITCSSVVVRSGPSKSNKSLTIFVDVLNFERNEAGAMELVPVRDRITIQRKDIEVTRGALFLFFNLIITILHLFKNHNTEMYCTNCGKIFGFYCRSEINC